MMHVNLISHVRQNAKRRALLRRRCAGACTAYGVTLVLLCGAAYLAWGRGGSALEAELTKVNESIEKSDTAMGSVRASLATANDSLALTRSIADQPDWGLLLALLAAKTGDDVVLRTCDTAPVEIVAAVVDRKTAGKNMKLPKSPAPNAAAYTLHLGGLARSQLAVSQFVLRLERTGLFAKVTLVDTNREPFLSGDAIAFKLDCSLAGDSARSTAGGAR